MTWNLMTNGYQDLCEVNQYNMWTGASSAWERMATVRKENA